MTTLTRITTEFITEEDRIRLSGERATTDPVAIWLTRRILCLLVPALLEWLGRMDGGLHKADTLQGFAQQAARAGHTPQPPVRVATGGEQWVAQAIDLASNRQAVSLTFKASDGRTATLTLTAQPLRQWLNIVHDLWTKAEWSGAIWPAWVGQAPLITSQSIVMH